MKDFLIKAIRNARTVALPSRRTSSNEPDEGDVHGIGGGFPYWKSTRDKDAGLFWTDALERTGVSAVRARLASDSKNSQLDIIFNDQMMPKGFAEQWLSWHDRQQEQRMLDLQERMVSAANGSARAAKAAAFAAFLSVAATVVQVWIAWKQ